MSTLLRVERVHFDYQDYKVLRQATFDLEAGTCSALIGTNGSGKTTLLRIAAGVLRPASGSVQLQGRAIETIPLREVARIVALVPQQLELPFDFSVQQVVEQGRTPYVGLLRGLGREDRKAVDRALDLADLSSLRHRIFNELSGGEKQRVKIALGLAQQPHLLLLDEPTQNLDIGRQVELLDLLHFLRDEGMTILASIHDLHLVDKNFSTVLLLTPGQPLAGGSPEQMLKPSILERAFQCPPDRHPLLIERAELYRKEAR
ncbi:MAG TPA: ABC transporter ATP-binding protein [Acidobacteriaceae bacterium]|nr:ABC transporter ATP-binding protein [Acidobacteriaceae bacterium]